MVQCASISSYTALALLRTAANDGEALPTSPWDTAQQFEFKGETIRMVQEHAGGGGNRGTRSQHGGRNRVVSERVTGGWTMEPTPTELQSILEIALGLAPVGNVYGLDELLPKFGLLVDKVASRYLYNGCLVNKITFSAQQKSNLTCAIEIEGDTELPEPAAFSTFNVPQIVDEQPYILADSTLVLDGREVSFKSFTITVDNVLDVDRFLNSLGRECIPATDRVVTASFEIPFTEANTVLHDLPAIGIPGTLSFGRGTSSTVFNFPRLQVPADTPAGSSRGDELMLDLEFQARYDVNPNDEMTITHIV